MLFYRANLIIHFENPLSAAVFLIINNFSKQLITALWTPYIIKVFGEILN